MDLGDFGRFEFCHNGATRPVFTHGSGPAVILCHEIAGLSPRSIQLARRISGAGFTVFAPVLFGKPGKGAMLRGSVQVCLSREFTTFRLGRSSPVSDWLRALAAEAERRAGMKGVAAIGMCVTGGIVIPVLLADCALAAVASQPSLPVSAPFCSRRRRADLGMSEGDLNAVKDTGKPVFGLRFERDFVCPRERVERIDEELPGPPSRHLTSSKPTDHSVLTYPIVDDPPGHPTREAFDAVVGFLHENLGRRP